jgi:hypothetical protein
LAEQAELVPDRNRGPDDPAAGAAGDGRAGRPTTTEVPGSHAIYVSQPSAVASLITQAARSLRETNEVI